MDANTNIPSAHPKYTPYKCLPLVYVARREFENVDFGCEKEDKCKIEQTVPFERKLLHGFKDTSF